MADDEMLTMFRSRFRGAAGLRVPGGVSGVPRDNTQATTPITRLEVLELVLSEP
ncbi:MULTISPECIES: hypothetical protein [unclassified Microbacterium]|uniref:hypothetical protein n=1 Tax=unclassified Microbacterium TaxID=2609290 RepID=UPI0015A23920|nr:MULTISPECIES: hypothetical protein [unclassified Microbacterium]